MRKYDFIVFCLGLILIRTSVLGYTLDNLTFPDSVSVGGNELKLNGAGFRKATVFKLKVYGAALYVKEPQQNAETILAAKAPKVLVMKFTRSVSQEKINEAWDKAFESHQSQFKNEIQKLKSLMPNTQEGDTLEYTFLENLTELKYNGNMIGTLPGGGWGKTLLSTWLGKNPPTEELKNSLLGKSE